MSGPVVRLNDLCSGHDDYPPRKSVECSPDVMFEGDWVVRYGDKLESHCNTAGSCHDGVHIGQHDTIVNGKSIQVGGDPISCGSVCDTAASNSISG
jgi:uncharacterized Zn-binding protein involved in type VI secretion